MGSTYFKRRGTFCFPQWASVKHFASSLWCLKVLDNGLYISSSFAYTVIHQWAAAAVQCRGSHALLLPVRCRRAFYILWYYGMLKSGKWLCLLKTAGVANVNANVWSNVWMCCFQGHTVPRTKMSATGGVAFRWLFPACWFIKQPAFFFKGFKRFQRCSSASRCIRNLWSVSRLSEL